MSALVPSPLDCIGPRRFAFYPPIKNIETNEWILGVGSWTEVRVVNAKTGGEIWVPRQYIGAVADPNGSVPIVGLTKELAYRAGSLEPRVKRVIEMPQKTEEPLKIGGGEQRRPPGPAPVIGIRIEDRQDSPMNRALITFGVGALIVSLIAAVLALFNSCTVNRGKSEDTRPASRAASRVTGVPGARGFFDHVPNPLGRHFLPTFAQLR